MLSWRADLCSAGRMSENGKIVSGQTTVVVHPLVLLSVVDHYNRACKVNKARAVGVLLGSWKKGGLLDIANSFAGLLAPAAGPQGAPIDSSLGSAVRGGREAPRCLVLRSRLSRQHVRTLPQSQR